jgi:hypothetical protein
MARCNNNVIGGVVAGEVGNRARDVLPKALLWEQSGIRYVIYLEP